MAIEGRAKRLWRWVLVVQVLIEVLLLMGALVYHGTKANVMVLPIAINLILMIGTIKMVRKKRACCS